MKLELPGVLFLLLALGLAIVFTIALRSFLDRLEEVKKSIEGLKSELRYAYLRNNRMERRIDAIYLHMIPKKEQNEESKKESDTQHRVIR